jgi:CRISPR-associated protein Cmr4
VTVECAEITPRVQLYEDRKTVRNGPFYAEYLPAETLLAAVVEAADDSHLAQLRALLDGEVLRIGGDETIGKGLMWCRFADKAEILVRSQ